MMALFGRSLVAYNMNSFRPLSHIEAMTLEEKVNEFSSFVARAAHAGLAHILSVPAFTTASDTK